ncbi:MAG TPA: glycosyltransferase family 1 protein [Solirubrobacteraceae bacterium]|nr:glycosyltransferase family 1 protein [Solirubrobacteraceae bacterium]
MRIAIDANVLEGKWGGIPKYLDRIARELVDMGEELRLLANTSRPVREIPGATPVRMRVKGTSLWRNVFLPLWLTGARADVLWAPESVLPRRSPVASVLTIHDLAMLRLPGTKSAEHEHGFRTSVRRSVARATRVIAVSQATARDLSELWDVPREKIRVVGLGVDEAFTPGDRRAARAAARARWGIETPFVLHVGALEPRKGLDVLIAAAELAAREGAAWRVVLAGMPGFRGEEIAAAARASGACTLLGPVRDAELLDLYRAADAYAAPALYEGFGMPPLEAMACATPVAIAAGGGALEEISGPGAIVVGERTPAAWREALERAIARPPELIERGLAHAASFGWREVAAQTLAVLGEAASARPALASVARHAGGHA